MYSAHCILTYIDDNLNLDAGYNTSAAVSYIPSPTIEKTMVKHVNSTSEPRFNSYAKRSLHFEHRPSSEYIQSTVSCYNMYNI